MKNSIISLAVISSLATSTAIADDHIDELVVTAKGGQTLANVLPTSHILSSVDIEAAQIKDIPALLDSISGISVRDSGGRGSATGVFLRGTQSGQTIVLIDGVRVGSATLGSAALNSYPVEVVERIEVVKGPLSGIYGADAVGGVIQLFTKKGGEGLGTVSVSAGSDSLIEYGVAFNGGNDKHSFRISANVEDTDGIDRTSLTENGSDDDDSFEEQAFSFAGKTTLTNNTTAQLSVLYSDNEAEFDDLFGGTSIGLLIENKTVTSTLNITSNLSETLRWTTLAGINKDESVTPAPASFPSSFTTNRDSLGTELEIDLVGNSILTIGADYYEEDIESLTEYPVTKRDNKGVFAQIQSELGNLGLVSSIRYDDNSAYGTDTNGSIAVNYQFNDSTRAVLSYGTAFVAPSFNFLYFPFFGNPDLLPEESDSTELSILGDNGKLNWRISAYQTDVENLFSFDPVTFLAANIGEAELKGIEFELGTELADWLISANLDLLSAEDKGTGIELDDRAERTLNITAARNFGAFDLRFDLKVEEGRFDNRGTELASYGLFDVSGSYQFNDKLTLQANIDNLFDKDYTVNLIRESDRYNTEGRQVKLKLKYDF